MKSMSKTTIRLGLVLAVTVAAAAAAGHGSHAPWGGEDGDPALFERFHDRRLEHLAGFLDLTEQQVAQWQAVHESRRGAMEGHRESLHALHGRIDELAGAEDPDAAAVGELVIEAHRRRQAVRAEVEAVHEELMSLLTPEQRDRFEAMREPGSDHDLRGRHGRRGGHRPRFRDGAAGDD